MSRRAFDTHVRHVAEWLAHSGRQFQPSREQAQGFLRRLDAEARFFSFRTFSESACTRLPGRDPLEQALHGSLDDCWETLVRLNRQGACVCVTINATNGRGRTPRDVLKVRALALDDDHPERRASLGIRPHISVQSSPGRYHHYWRVVGLALDDFVPMQRELAAGLAGDDKICALNFAMALPGFWRRKPGRVPVMTRLLERPLVL